MKTMQHITTAHPRGWKQRMLGALLLAGSVLALTASAASADMVCNVQPDSNMCLTIEPVTGGWYAVKVGIDITNISLQESLDLIAAAHAAGRSLFTGEMWGQDGGFVGSIHDKRLFVLRDCSATAYWGVLYGECYMEVPRNALNEDTDGRDELYAVVRLVDCRSSCHISVHWHSHAVYLP